MEKQEQDYNLFDWWYKVVFKNFANFDGRARRKEYWYFVLVNLIISFVLGIIDGLAGLTIGPVENGNGILGTISSLVLIFIFDKCSINHLARTSFYFIIS